MTTTILPVIDRYDAIQYDGTNEADIAAAVPQYVFVSEIPAGLQFQSGSGTWFCPPGGWIVYSVRFQLVFSQWNNTAMFEEGYRELLDGATLVGLQTDVTALQGDVTTLQSDVNIAETDIDALQSGLTTAQGNISTLQGSMSTAQGSISTLQGNMSTAQGQISTLTSTLAALASQVADSVAASGAGTFSFGPGNTNVNVDIKPARPDTTYDVYAQIFGGINLGALTITGTAIIDTDTVRVTVNNSGLVALGASILVTITE